MVTLYDRGGAWATPNLFDLIGVTIRLLHLREKQTVLAAGVPALSVMYGVNAASRF
ncbi:MAG: hypothetical protein IT165_19910 [Bryobacterales bacterium]|nr:hypothetical protein [Bryobacterales bacterium]